MSQKVMIHYPHLQALTNNQEWVEVNGSTIGQCLDDLVNQFPGIRTRIFNEQGKLLHYIMIFHNVENTRTEPDPLAKPVSDGDEITIALLIAGG